MNASWYRCTILVTVWSPKPGTDFSRLKSPVFTASKGLSMFIQLVDLGFTEDTFKKSALIHFIGQFSNRFYTNQLILIAVLRMFTQRGTNVIWNAKKGAFCHLREYDRRFHVFDSQDPQKSHHQLQTGKRPILLQQNLI